MKTISISITDLRRNFGKIEELLAKVNSLIITKKGKHIATLTPSMEYKKELLKKTAGSLKNTDLDSDKLWAAVYKKRSRQKSIKL